MNSSGTIIDYVDLLLPNLEYVRARIVKEPRHGLVRDASRKYRWSNHGLSNGDFAIEVVGPGGEVIAAFAWYPKTSLTGGRRIVTAGTYVHERHQRRGLAKAMWRAMIERERPPKISVTVISDRGNTLALSMRAEYPLIDFEIKDFGDRKLRDLRKGKASAA